MSGPREPPASVRVLTKWVDAYARERGLTPKRVRDWISYMMVGGRLEGASAIAEGPRFTIKGAVAIEMRLPSKARATKDIDREVFGIRRTHAWPPWLDPPAFWQKPFTKLAEEVSLPGSSLEEAVQEARTFIEAIDGAG